ncbi:MAG: hypothetical protein ABEJ46_02530, partial [Gemmatimonadota bacterium]
MTESVAPTWGVVLERMVRLAATEPGTVLAYLLDGARRNRDFARGVVRIWLAYRTGALRYHLLVGRKRGPRRRRRRPPARERVADGEG